MVFSGFIQTLRAPGESAAGLVNEVKFVGDEALANQAGALLDAVCLPDGEYPEGRINSIYFDGPARISLAEKVDGDNLKLKVRIRWYGRPAGAEATEIPVFIEAKRRLGSARRKARVAVPAPAQWIAETPLDDDRLTAFLYRHAAALGEEIPLNLAPVLCISYERRRFRCPQTGSRIALDRNIRAGRINPRQFPVTAPVHLDRAVCEIKTRGQPLPGWTEALYRVGFRQRSFSKYGECMNRVLLGGAPA